MIGEFFKIYYNPNSVLETLEQKMKSSASLFAKLMIGFMLTLMASMIAFFGVFVLEIYFLARGKISFGLSLFMNPFLATIIIPVFFWIIDTILLVIGIVAVGGKLDFFGLLNIRAFSMAPIPIKVLYVYYTTRSIALSSLLGLPTSIISWALTIWSILLLANGLRKIFRLGWGKGLLVAVIPFLFRVLIFGVGTLL